MLYIKITKIELEGYTFIDSVSAVIFNEQLNRFDIFADIAVEGLNYGGRFPFIDPGEIGGQFKELGLNRNKLYSYALERILGIILQINS